MSKYADIEQIKEVIRSEWVKYIPMDLDINLSFVLGKISEVPTIEAMKYPQVDGITPTLVTPEFSEDAISREWLKKWMFTEWDGNQLTAFKMTDFAPSVIPNAKEGEWIVRENSNNECSVCGREKQDGWVNFCGFCGAKMKGVNDEA